MEGTVEHEVLFEKHGHLEVHGFTKWNPNDRKSTAGCFTFMGENLVIWRSKKQKVVALLSAESAFQRNKKWSH